MMERLFWWLWTGALDKDGYGTLNHVPAHRLLYEALAGPIPEGLVFDHLCRVTNCVCPRHLEPVTDRENVIRGVQARRLIAQQEHPVAR